MLSPAHWQQKLFTHKAIPGGPSVKPIHGDCELLAMPTRYTHTTQKLLLRLTDVFICYLLLMTTTETSPLTLVKI